MRKKYLYLIIALVLVIIIGMGYFFAKKQIAQPTQNKMTFFVTSENPGKGADLGGLAGADAYCQVLATNAGAGNKTWHAYLSTTATNSTDSINARDRIGNGPWKNFQGTIIANNIKELHENNNITKQTALTEKGQIVNGRGDTPNLHDILTGSGPDGRMITGDSDTTCGNWTKSNEGSAMLGHSDRVGTSDTAEARSWNSSHLSRGCDLKSLASTGSGGLFYCFAITK